jgi:hypothetical protein
MTSKSPLELWQEKCTRLQQARVLATDTAVQMKLDYDIEECVKKIQELGGNIPNNNPTSNPNTPESVLNSPKPLSPQEELRLLRDLFLACPSFKNHKERDVIINQLRPEIARSITRSNDANTDTINIIIAARNYSGGLQELLGVMELFEEGTIHFQALKEGIEKLSLFR